MNEMKLSPNKELSSVTARIALQQKFTQCVLKNAAISGKNVAQPQKGNIYSFSELHNDDELSLRFLSWGGKAYDSS